MAIRAARRISCSHRLGGVPLPKSNFSLGSFSRRTASYHSPSAPTNGKTQMGATTNSQLSSSVSTAPQGNRNACHLTPTEVQEYRAKGKCYHCGERYSPLHKCTAKYLTVILDAKEYNLTVEGEDLEQVIRRWSNTNPGLTCSSSNSFGYRLMVLMGPKP